MASRAERIAKIQEAITDYPDFPKKGVLFRDVFPVMRNPELFDDLISLMTDELNAKCSKVDVIVGLESRGFIFGPLIAQRMKCAFVPIRKKGKLPGECVSASYTLEYGADCFEAQKDSIQPGQRVAIIDDLLATGGTMSAAYKLMTDMKAEIACCFVVIELADLKGSAKIPGGVVSLVSYSD